MILSPSVAVDLIATTYCSKNMVLQLTGDPTEVYIVAEIGQNHQGSFELAKRMIREAKSCGVDCVKFQKTNLGEKFTESALKKPYESVNSFGATYGDHKRRLEFSVEEMCALKDYATEIDIDFGVSPMDPSSMRDMIAIQPSFIKIGSGDTNNFPLLVTAARSGIPVILSTGMQKRSTIEQALDILRKGTKNFAVLHCISSYPTLDKDVNLSQMLYLKDKGIVTGYSGHELGFNPSMMAVILGAKIVERHFTLDKNMKGSDHKCSLDPRELRDFVRLVRRWERSPEVSKLNYFPGMSELALEKFIEQIMGCPRTEDIYPCEQACQDKLGKSIVYKNTLKSGAIICQEDLCIKVCEPKGIVPEDIYQVIGSNLNCDVKADDAVLEEHLKRNK